jgi:hypothetical protein
LPSPAVAFSSLRQLLLAFSPMGMRRLQRPRTNIVSDHAAFQTLFEAVVSLKGRPKHVQRIDEVDFWRHLLLQGVRV